MDKYEVYYSPLASNDLKEIYTYIAVTLCEKSIAEKQVNKIRSAVKSLDTLPSRNKRVEPELEQPEEMRKMFAGNYVIFYLVDEQRKEVNVVRILYSKRNFKNILNE